MKLTSVFYLKVGLILFWASILFYTLVNSVGINPLLPSYKNKVNLVSLIPEGWSFFTRNPREEQIRVYKEADGKLVNMTHSNFSLYNKLGFARYTRSRSIELNSLLASVRETAWVDCGHKLQYCLKTHALNSIPVKNTTTVQSLSGTLIIEKREPVPWAWFQSGKEIIMPGKIIKMEVSLR